MKASSSATSLTSLVPEEMESSGSHCIICLGEEQLIKCIGSTSCACVYYYHDSCLGDWIREKPMECPMCRKRYEPPPASETEKRVCAALFYLCIAISAAAGLATAGLIIWKMAE